MGVDEHRCLAPGTARVLEVADQLFLLSVDRDDRLGGVREALALFGDVAELFIAIGIGTPGERLVISAQREFELLEDFCDRLGTDLDAQALQLTGDLPGGATRERTRG